MKINTAVWILVLVGFTSGDLFSDLANGVIDQMYSAMHKMDPILIGDTHQEFNLTLGPFDFLTFGLLNRINLFTLKWTNTSISGLANLARTRPAVTTMDKKHYICHVPLSVAHLTFRTISSVTPLTTLFSESLFSIPVTASVSDITLTVVIKMASLTSQPFVDDVTVEKFERVSFLLDVPIPLAGRIANQVTQQFFRILNGPVRYLFGQIIKGLLNEMLAEMKPNAFAIE